MFSVVIKKRTLKFTALALAGAVLLLLGWRFGLPGKKATLPEVQVNLPADGKVSFESVTQSTPKDKSSGANRVKEAAVEGADFFVEYRLERDRARGQRVEWLREVANNAGSAGETRQKAQENIMNISRCMEKEVVLENLVRAKGFKESAVLVDDRGAVTVIVATASLTGEEIARLTELVSRGAGQETQNVVIIPKT